MAYINKITTPDMDTFPGAVFEQTGDVPIAQCQETQIDKIGTGNTDGSTAKLTDGAAFTGFDLAGKILSISAPPGNVGDYTVISNDNNILTLASTPPASSGVNSYTVHDTGQAYLTRDINSFAEFIHNAGYAYTIKGGKLYTDCPNLTLADACSTTWNPGD